MAKFVLKLRKEIRELATHAVAYLDSDIFAAVTARRYRHSTKNSIVLSLLVIHIVYILFRCKRAAFSLTCQTRFKTRKTCWRINILFKACFSPRQDVFYPTSNDYQRHRELNKIGSKSLWPLGMILSVSLNTYILANYGFWRTQDRK